MAPVLTKNAHNSDNEDSNSSTDLEPKRKRKRVSRWLGSNADPKAFIPGMPTIIPSNITKDQEKAYLTQLRIEEITRALRTGDLGIPSNPENRSPSPEPVYDNAGKRLNTREVRARGKLEGERHKLILEMMKLNPEYKPPGDYKPPANKIVDKVFIPQEEHPDINFVGLLIGPRGNTLKKLEQDTCAKIIIRGKGSIKEGKIGRKDGQPLPGEDEPLHAYITGATVEVVQKACQKVREIVNQGIEVPETMNDLRKSQLRELALLNGTLRENDSLNKLKIIAQAQTIVTNTIICSLCGGAGHITSDCKMKKERESSTNSSSGDNSSHVEQPRPVTWAEREKMDSEYHSLMAELGQGPPVDSKSSKSGKSIVSRNGASNNSGHILAIDSGHNHSNQQQHHHHHHHHHNNNNNNNKPSSSNDGVDANREEDVKPVNKPPPLMSLVGSATTSSTGGSSSNSNNASPNPNAATTATTSNTSAVPPPPPMDQQHAMMQHYYAQQMQYYAQMQQHQYMWPGYGWPPAPGSVAPPPPPPPPPPSS